MRGNGGDGEVIIQVIIHIIHIGVGREQDLARGGADGTSVITGNVELLTNVLDR